GLLCEPSVRVRVWSLDSGVWILTSTSTRLHTYAPFSLEPSSPSHLLFPTTRLHTTPNTQHTSAHSSFHLFMRFLSMHPSNIFVLVLSPPSTHRLPSNPPVQPARLTVYAPFLYSSPLFLCPACTARFTHSIINTNTTPPHHRTAAVTSLRPKSLAVLSSICYTLLSTGTRHPASHPAPKKDVYLGVRQHRRHLTTYHMRLFRLALVRF
ncbi:hypothetical protein K439DRAFT_1638116, partial [Ramaria rubella]